MSVFPSVSGKCFVAGLIVLRGLFVPLALKAQNLCNNAGSDGFEIPEGMAGCSPFRITIQNKVPGATNLQYKLDYLGSEERVIPGGETETIFTRRNEESSTYTILQTGKDASGKDFYNCKTITVKKALKPVFSFNSCNGNFLRINIPEDSSNIFDYYLIDWNDGRGKDSVFALPYDGFKSYPNYEDRKQISVEGKFQKELDGCNTLTQLNVNMLEDGSYSNFATLELDSSLENVTINLDAAFADYKLFQRTANESFQNGQWSDEIPNGLTTISLPSPQTCFTTFRNFGCIEVSGEVCTLPIIESFQTEQTNVIKWLEHPTGIVNNIYYANSIVDSVSYIIKREDLVSGEIQEFLGSTDTFMDSVNCAKQYEYQVIAHVFGTIRGNGRTYHSVTKSQKVIFDHSSNKPKPITDLLATVKDHQAQLVFQDNLPNVRKERFYVYSRHEGGNFKLEDSTQNSGDFISDLSPEDQSVCFQITYKDQCSRVSDVSPEVCTVYLNATQNEVLEWEFSNPFGNDSVTIYSLLTYENENLVTTEKTGNFNGGERFLPDMENYEEQAFFFLEINGTKSKSLSNTVNIPKRTKLFFPEAFSPNGDGINDVWKVFGNLNTLKSFKITIFDRRGTVLFQTNDKQEPWNGYHNNTPAPAGTYNYHLYATSQTNEILDKTGYILLLR